MEISLPSLELILYQKIGYRNIARQLLSYEKSISLNLSEKSNFHLLMQDSEDKICLTTKPDNIEYDHTCRYKFESIPTTHWLQTIGQGHG